MNIGRVEIPFGKQNLIIETGKIAKQANASVFVTLGGTSVIVAVCMSKKVKPGQGFFPLMVEYQEKGYAAGKIPGGFFKREGRPTQKETLTARIIDRPIRPLFPEGFLNDVVVTCNVVSSDGENDPDIVAMLGASAALHISDIPFDGPIGGVRLLLKDGEYILNPTYEEREDAEMELFVVGVRDGIVMIEGEGAEVSEDKVVEGLKKAQEYIVPMIDAQNKFKEEVGKAKTEVEVFKPHPDLKAKVSELSYDRLLEAYKVADKLEREDAINAILDDLLSDLSVFDAYKPEGEEEIPVDHIRQIYDQVDYDVVRKQIFENNVRADGRKPEEIRDLASEIEVLPRTHGSALFTRGQTQSLAVVTLGTKRDEQMIEGLQGLAYNNYMLHYNFPSFSVGEARGSRGPGRREIGHGALAAKSIKGVLPKKEDFPYTIRVVSEILESNGSSSMASVCAGCLSLMAAGVPLKNPVAGISVGLVQNDSDYRLLVDIMGLEDHHGDMDYKIAGSREGITAIQLDLKVQGLSLDILADGIQKAKEAREKILDNMQATISAPKEAISPFAPQIERIMIPVEKIGEVIGPGGKMIKKIMENTGCESIDIEDDGQVCVSGSNAESVQKAVDYIKGFTQMPEVGKVYDAKVVKIMPFGAFCEFLPGKEGLVHISEMSNEFVKEIETIVKEGDEFKVKLIEIDKQGRLNLSRKQAEEVQAG